MFQGEVQTFPLPDLIQWIALTRRTGRLELTHGDCRLEFYFAAGEFAAVSSSHIIGPDSPEKARAVLASALSWKLGYFIFEGCDLPAGVAAAGLRLPAESLLLDAACRLDEERRVGSKTGEVKVCEVGDRPETFTPADELRLRIVDHLLREDFRVPPTPQLAARVLELTGKDFSLRELGNLILTDQVVAAQILRYANSALGGAERHVETLPMAIHRLGADEVVNVALAISLHARRPRGELFAEQRRRLWTQSNVAAFFAHTLAARVGLDPHLGFLCGLLLDFGVSVLYSLVAEVLGRDYASAEVVAQIVQDYHPRVGRVVAEKWQLPRAVVESIAYHHCLEGATTERRYVSVSALADALATLALGRPREALSTFPPEQLSGHPAGRALGLNTERASAVLHDLPRQLDRALKSTAA